MHSKYSTAQLANISASRIKSDHSLVCVASARIWGEVRTTLPVPPFVSCSFSCFVVFFPLTITVGQPPPDTRIQVASGKKNKQKTNNSQMWGGFKAYRFKLTQNSRVSFINQKKRTNSRRSHELVSHFCDRGQFQNCSRKGASVTGCSWISQWLLFWLMIASVTHGVTARWNT